ncbi:hypothetical protein BFP97_15960 [Roseivirga sp. 4D4]|uniref:universal stress protein n=1 Tax=Roseivirga sp. 4D4 TaxID=1889784 RepID=UPI0008537A6E|nr:universal stress protein [Roseivirga sp. 4D4]OEK02927.1 hypothetical protein BFP97_15960 [Roseivirga sp. 4D4]
MFNQILVPVDFSQKSRHSLEMACQIAEISKGEVDVFHIVQAALSVQMNEAGEYESLGSSGKQFLQDILQSNQLRLERLTNEYKSENFDLKLRLKVDDLPDKVAEHIHNENYDLLIVGGHTEYKIDSAFGINHNERIVRLAKKPVLVVNNPSQDRRIKKILVPTDFTNNYEQSAHQLKEIQQFFDARLEFLHINTPSFFSTSYELDKRIASFQNKHNFENCDFKVVSDKSRKKGILRASMHYGADMILLLSFQPNQLQRILRGDITEYVVNHSELPVMVLNVEK